MRTGRTRDDRRWLLAASSSWWPRLWPSSAADKHAEHLSGARGVVPCLEASFWNVATHDTLEDALIAAVDLGNDGGSTGAVPGGIAVAR